MPTTSPLAHFGIEDMSLAGWPAGWPATPIVKARRSPQTPPHPRQNPSPPGVCSPRAPRPPLLPATHTLPRSPHPIPRSHRRSTAIGTRPEPTQWRRSPSPPPSQPSPRTASSCTRPSKVPLRPPTAFLTRTGARSRCTRRRLTRSAFPIDRRLGHQREADHLHPGPPQRRAAPRDPPRLRRCVREGAAPRSRRRDPRQVRGR